MLKFNVKYFILCISIFIVEVIIAIFVKDKIIRPYFGDYLVIFLIYFFVLSFIRFNKNKIALWVLVFAFCIEIAQYFEVLTFFHLEKNRILKIIAGTTFSVHDLCIYTFAYLTILFFNKKSF